MRVNYKSKDSHHFYMYHTTIPSFLPSSLSISLESFLNYYDSRFWSISCNSEIESFDSKTYAILATESNRGPFDSYRLARFTIRNRAIRLRCPKLHKKKKMVDSNIKSPRSETGTKISVSVPTISVFSVPPDSRDLETECNTPIFDTVDCAYNWDAIFPNLKISKTLNHIISISLS
ncbi:hypothetical protein PIB30_046231 [Stylosanthes scabra]|uniref:Uncharacterized protein n=1 Tax=Stylosanthes scabra TaxID=79078 RepID=A0ABU6TI98_9FABA|nr:hypothetical protein [Stylosanthes scabra]